MVGGWFDAYEKATKSYDDLEVAKNKYLKTMKALFEADRELGKVLEKEEF